MYVKGKNGEKKVLMVITYVFLISSVFSNVWFSMFGQALYTEMYLIFNCVMLLTTYIETVILIFYYILHHAVERAFMVWLSNSGDAAGQVVTMGLINL